MPWNCTASLPLCLVPWDAFFQKFMKTIQRCLELQSLRLCQCHQSLESKGSCLLSSSKKIGDRTRLRKGAFDSFIRTGEKEVLSISPILFEAVLTYRKNETCTGKYEHGDLSMCYITRIGRWQLHPKTACSLAPG